MFLECISWNTLVSCLGTHLRHLSVCQSSLPSSATKPSTELHAQPITDDLAEQLDAEQLALSEKFIRSLLMLDPLADLLTSVNRLVGRVHEAENVKLGATYTFLDQYATVTPDGVRHDQISGRLDFTGAWIAYRDESSEGSISLLVRSGTNISLQPDRFPASR